MNKPGSPFRLADRPNLTGKVDPAVDESMKRVYDKLTDIHVRLSTVERMPYVSTPVAEATYGPKVMAKQLSATGSAPLNVGNLLGQLAQPQLAAAYISASLPTPGMRAWQNGALVIQTPTKNLYYVDLTTSPGVLRSIAAVGVISFGLRSATPAAGNTGYQYFQTDIGALYIDNGSNYIYEAGIVYGTNANRIALSIGVNDNGLPWLTSDTQKLWRVTAGAWLDVTPIAASVSTRAFGLMLSGA